MSFLDLAPPTPCCADALRVALTSTGALLVIAALLV